MEYKKEEIKEKVMVPFNVEVELRRLIEEKLNQSGVFYRVFSRTKTAASLEKKFAKKTYDDSKKIQDLIGVRINVYYQDDVRIVKRLMENLFSLVEWSENKVDTTNFEPVKVNGVFRLPNYLAAKISRETWDINIDQTFEIQLKTVFFEGWHEVEHDMRYKYQDIWKRYESYSRRFNSIVATLELCDRAMLDVFDDFAHSLYKENDWAGMLRMHFRIRISDQPLYEEYIPVLEADEKKLGKALLRFDRAILIEYLSNFHRDIPISVNLIIALINDRYFDDTRLKEIGREHRVYHDGISVTVNERKKRTLRKMNDYVIYNNKVTIDYQEDEKDRTFQKVSGILYRWLWEKFRPVFPELSKEKTSMCLTDSGYLLKTESREAAFLLQSSHVDHEVAGRIWNTRALLEFRGEALCLDIVNYISDVNYITEEELINQFSAPRFYANICRDSDLPVRDVRRLKDSVKTIKGDKNPQDSLYELILHPQRFLPVVLIVYRANEEEEFDRSELGYYWGNNLARWTKNYAHVYESGILCCEELKEYLNGENTLQTGVYLFYPAYYQDEEEENRRAHFYSEEEIVNWKQTPGENGILNSKNSKGSEAFMNDLVRKIKKINISYREEKEC